MNTTRSIIEVDTDDWEGLDKGADVRFMMVSAFSTRHLDPNSSVRSHLVHWRVGAAYDVFNTEMEAMARSTVYDTYKQDSHSGAQAVTVDIASKRYHYSTRAVKHVRFEVAKAFTTMDVLNHIIQKGYHRYETDVNASGCLYWTKTIIASLERDGFIHGGSSAALEVAVQETRVKSGLWVPDDGGSFF